MASLQNAYVLVMVVLLLGVTILVHEFGHFVAARLCGLFVQTFSIGFGPALWKRRRRGVLYRIGCIPFGGYVALPQLDPAGMRRLQGPAGEGGALPPVAAWKKIVVSLSGAAGNVLLAVALSWIVFWVGIPAGPAERSATVGYVDPDSKAFERGMRIGDEILSVNGTPVKKWSDFRVAAACRTEVELRVRSASGETRTIALPTEKGMLGEQTVKGVEGMDLCVVSAVDPHMSAHAAGMMRGDTIIRFAGERVLSRAHLVMLVGAHQHQEVPVYVRRGVGDQERIVRLRVTPRLDPQGRTRIGIEFSRAAVEHDTIMHPRPWTQLREHTTLIVRVLRALATPKQARAASGSVGGPVAIMVEYWFIVRTSIMLAISFTCLLNVNLAVINLLPVPVLDGGHILFALWELVARRPPGERVVNLLVNAFAVALIALFVLLSVRDLDRFTSLGERVRRLFEGKADHSATGTAQRAEAETR